MARKKAERATLGQHCELGVSVQIAHNGLVHAAAAIDAILPRNSAEWVLVHRLYHDVVELKSQLDSMVYATRPSDYAAGMDLRDIYYCNDEVGEITREILDAVPPALELKIREEAS